jgi:DNA modification methylase
MRDRGTNLHSPKLQAGADRATPDWYRYYAGFSPAFVTDILDRFCAEPDQEIVLDPWNGSGTTTAAAWERGIPCIGVDLNPVAVLLAKARVLGPEVADSLGALTEEILESTRNEPMSPTDPLRTWFADSTAARIRSLERSIYHALVDAKSDALLNECESLSHISSLAAYYYTVLFSSVREALRKLSTSNPTWIKRPDPLERVDVSQPDFENSLRRVEHNLRTYVHATTPQRDQLRIRGAAPPEIDLGSSTALSQATSSVDLVITSPPYCTRIDYVVLTEPELAVLGLQDKVLGQLRDRMIGTPTMAKDASLDVDRHWGRTAKSFVESVRQHRSRASEGYYRKYFLQYLAGMYSSLAELQRVIRPPGRCVLVVQDSFYKEVHLDLAAILIEMGKSVGLRLTERFDFTTKSTMAAVHPAARRYRQSFEATESVLVLRAPA